MKDEAFAVGAPPLAMADLHPSSGAKQETSQADRMAVQGTNLAYIMKDGTMDWQEAHERWMHETRERLSPAAFAKRIMDLGGGNNIRYRRSPVISKASPAPVGLNGGTPHQQPTTILEHRPINHAEQNRPRRPSLQEVVQNQQTELDQLQAQVSQMSRTITHLSKVVEDLSRDRSHSDSTVQPARPLYDAESFDLLAETVSNHASKIGEIDSIKLNVDACKRRLRRLESGEVEQSVAPPNAGNADRNSDGQPLLQRLRPTESQHLSSLTPPPSATQRNSDLQENSHGYPRLAPRGESVPRGGLVSSVPRKRGRPSKMGEGYDTNVEGFDDKYDGSPPYENVIRDTDTGLDHPTGPGLDRGRVVRRGSGMSFTEQPSKRTRQKPIRMPDGSLMRKDGRPDKRSTSSALNLKKRAEKEKQRAVELEQGTPHASSEAGISPINTSNVVDNEQRTHYEADVAQMRRSDETSGVLNGNHETIMKKMFPHGLGEERRRMDHARNIFSANRSPEQEKVQPRRELQKGEILNESSPAHRLSRDPAGSDHGDFRPLQSGADPIPQPGSDEIEMADDKPRSEDSTSWKPANIPANLTTS